MNANFIIKINFLFPTEVHQLNAYKQSDENFGNGIDIELSNMNEFKEDINSLSDGVSTDSTTNKMHRF